MQELLPNDPEERILFLYRLYMSSAFDQDKDIFNEIVEMTGGAVSAITLKRYKKRFGWDRNGEIVTKVTNVPKRGAPTGKKKIKHPDPEYQKKKIKTPKRGRPKNGESKKEKTTPTPQLKVHTVKGNSYVQNEAKRIYIVEQICKEYIATGESWEPICKRFGINVPVLLKWVNSNPIMWDIYSKTVSDSLKGYALELEHLVRHTLLEKFRTKTTTEIRTYYGYELKPDKKTGEMVEIPVKKNRVKIEKQYHVDPHTIAEALRVISETKMLFSAEDKKIPDVGDLSDEQINKRIKELEEQIREYVREDQEYNVTGEGITDTPTGEVKEA